MKKILALVLVLFISLLVVGCTQTEVTHGPGERCKVNADCPHADDICHSGFCESPEEHGEEESK